MRAEASSTPIPAGCPSVYALTAFSPHIGRPAQIMTAFSPLVSIASRICVAASLIVVACGATRAQPILLPPETPKEVLDKAFASPFGRAIIAEFNARMREGADPACLKAKPRTAAEHAAQGEAFLTAWGLWSLEQFYKRAGNRTIDATAEAVLAPNTIDKFRWMMSAPEVIRYRELERPVLYSDTIYFVLEIVDRYILIQKLNMGPVSPINTGKPELLEASGIEKAQDAALDHFEAKKTEQLTRYIEFDEKVRQALVEAAKPDEFSATALLRTADQDLGRLCVLRKP